MADGEKKSGNETSRPLERRAITMGGFSIDGDRYYSPILLKYGGKVFAVYAYDMFGRAIGIIERGGLTHPIAVPLLSGVHRNKCDSEMFKYMCVVGEGGFVNFLGKLFLGNGLGSYEGEVVTILPPDNSNEPYLAEIDGQFFELLTTSGEAEDRYFNMKAIEISKHLHGMSIAQAEFVLKEAGAILKSFTYVSSADVDEAERQLGLLSAK